MPSRRRSRCARGRAGCRDRPAARATVSAPRRSGAKVICATAPGAPADSAASRTVSTSAGSTSVSAAGSCAPRRSWERNGPSRWMPARSPRPPARRRCAPPPPSRQPAAETRLPSRVVVPFTWWWRTAVAAESAAAPNSPPAPPWQWTSTSPGSKVCRPARHRRPARPAREPAARPPTGVPDGVPVHHQRAVLDDGRGGDQAPGQEHRLRDGHASHHVALPG